MRCKRRSLTDCDVYVTVLLSLIARIVGGDNPKNIIAFRQRRRVPHAGRSLPVFDGVRHLVKKPGFGAAVNGDSALCGVGDLRGGIVRRKTIEEDGDAWLVKTGAGEPSEFRSW